MEETERYLAYRKTMTPYLRYMVLLSSLFRTCGMQVTPQGALLIHSPGWMSLEAMRQYRHAAQTIARLRHAASRGAERTNMMGSLCPPKRITLGDGCSARRRNHPLEHKGEDKPRGIHTGMGLSLGQGLRDWMQADTSAATP